ncbi:MAG: hypothetical protein IJF92_01060 [Bacilli bacterium]|nr:hypothetical protein [Bacilli bacterium]
MKQDKRTNMVMAIILVLIVGISIGYAALTAALNITGQTTIGSPSWDVHFETLNVTSGSATATTPAAIQTNKLDINYAVTLNQPGDFYEFTVNVKNGGTIAAKLSANPTLAGLSDAQKVYTTYTATYSDGTTVSANDKLAAGASKTIKVRVEYKTDITASQLPTTAQNVTLTYAMNYIQD